MSEDTKKTTVSPSKKKDVKRKLANGTRKLTVSQSAYLKAAALSNVTSLEWSGYGPVVKNGNGYTLLDFYYLSSDDSYGETNLPPEAAAEAWKRIVDSKIDPLNVRLAWVHCHPSGGAFWSGTDWAAIDDSLDLQGTPGASQISVLFATGTGIIARYDTHEVSESMNVETDLEVGYILDIDKARAIQEEYNERLRKAEAERQKAVADAKALLAARSKDTDEELDDEFTVVYRYSCDICNERVERPIYAIECITCGFWVCENCVEDKESIERDEAQCKLCTDNEFERRFFKERELDGICFLCGSPALDGEYFCEACLIFRSGVHDESDFED